MDSLSKKVITSIILLKSSRQDKEQQANKDGRKDEDVSDSGSDGEVACDHGSSNSFTGSLH